MLLQDLQLDKPPVGLISNDSLVSNNEPKARQFKEIDNMFERKVIKINDKSSDEKENNSSILNQQRPSMPPKPPRNREHLLNKSASQPEFVNKPPSGPRYRDHLVESKPMLISPRVRNFNQPYNVP